MAAGNASIPAIRPDLPFMNGRVSRASAADLGLTERHEAGVTPGIVEDVEDGATSLGVTRHVEMTHGHPARIARQTGQPLELRGRIGGPHAIRERSTTCESRSARSGPPRPR